MKSSHALQLYAHALTKKIKRSRPPESKETKAFKQWQDFQVHKIIHLVTVWALIGRKKRTVEALFQETQTIQ